VWVPSPSVVNRAGSSSRFRSSKVWAKRAAFVLAALLAYSFVHAKLNADPYSHAAQEAFVSSCERGGATESSCRCIFSWMRQNVSVADYKSYTRLVTSPGYTASQTPPWVDQAIASCAPGAGAGAPN
jgi:hypothetical protein